MVDFTKTLSKWSLEYRHDEPFHSKHNVTCRFLNLFKCREIIEISLACRSDSASLDYVVWDAVSSRYEDIYESMFGAGVLIDADTFSTLDFVITLIVADADQEVCDQLMQNNIETSDVYLFENWVSPYSAVMHLYSLED